VFKARCRADGAPSRGGERRIRIPALARPPAFEAEPAALAGSLPKEISRPV
jgi:hypothetical protein